MDIHNFLQDNTVLMFRIGINDSYVRHDLDKKYIVIENRTVRMVIDQFGLHFLGKLHEVSEESLCALILSTELPYTANEIMELYNLVKPVNKEVIWSIR